MITITLFIIMKIVTEYLGFILNNFYALLVIESNINLWYDNKSKLYH